ncbi:MAG: polyprenyl synthetase family protein [Treponema sp.]|nr:polyprenyl synthetase family protein [Treponema sp.]
MDQEYTEQLKKIEAELERWLPENPDSAWIEQVFAGIAKTGDSDSLRSLLAPLRELVFRGGKRWRPLLMTLICKNLGGGDAAIPLSPIIEFSHNASLIHDDIEDDSDERRGKPAVHKLYGIDTAINSASFFYFLAANCIETCSFKNKELLYRYWTECMRKLHLGQAMDINWHRNVSIIPQIEDYYQMCAMKTGSLACLATELGAITAGVSAETTQLLGNAANKMGVGFQILDDVKNLTTGIPGKKRGDDVVEGKKGLPVLLYMHKYPEKRDIIFYYFHAAKNEGNAAPEVDDLIDTLNNAGVFPEAEEKGRALINEAKDLFSSHLNDNDGVLLDNFIKLIS